MTVYLMTAKMMMLMMLMMIAINAGVVPLDEVGLSLLIPL